MCIRDRHNEEANRFSVQENDYAEAKSCLLYTSCMETIKTVSISELHSFRNHPFKVETNTELCELMRSIEKEGVLVPLLVRTNPYGDGYEVISGHRRKEAALWAGETEVPVVIRELDDDQAVDVYKRQVFVPFERKCMDFKNLLC